MGRRKAADFLSLEEVGRLSGTGPKAAGPVSRLVVFNAWGRAVGPTLRAVTRPALFENGRLVIQVAAAAWLKELERLRPEIRGKLDEMVPRGEITSLAFVLRSSLPREKEKIAGAALQPRLPFEPVSEEAGSDLRRHLAEVESRYLRATGS